jgi:hypothetical protein
VKCADGTKIPGASIVDPVWNQMIEWHAVTQADFGRAQSREAILARLNVKPNGPALAARFDSLEFQQAAE